MARVNKEERLQINSEIKEMLRKGAIQQLKSQPGEFLSNLFLVNKKDGGNKSCNKSQISEQLHTLPKFQNGRNAFNKGSSPRTRLSDRDRSKRCLFWHTSRQKLRKIYLFLMGREFIRIPLLMFWPGSRPSDFHETWRINVRIIIFLDAMLVIAQTLKEISQAKKALIFLLQNLCFVINLKKSQSTLVKEIEFLRLVINSVNMTLVLPQEKVVDI